MGSVYPGIPNHSNDTLLNSSITNNNGIATCNTTIDSNSSFYSVFEGLSGKYPSSQSSIVNVEILEILYHPLLDGTETTYGTITTENGVMSANTGWGYLTDGWDNSTNWKLNFELNLSDFGTNIFVGISGKTLKDYQEIGISAQTHNSTIMNYVYNNSNLSQGNYVTVPKNTWIHIEIIKNGSTINYKCDGSDMGDLTWNHSSASNLVIGGNAWNNKLYQVRNILVEKI